MDISPLSPARVLPQAPRANAPHASGASLRRLLLMAAGVMPGLLLAVSIAVLRAPENASLMAEGAPAVRTNDTDEDTLEQHGWHAAAALAGEFWVLSTR